MLRSMFAGVSGLQSNQTKMDVVGNNISNLNTTGFKRGRVTFQEMFNQTLRAASAPQADRGGINPQEVGLGVRVGSIDTDHTQGNVESTGVDTDLAIEGNGFFIVSDGQENLYTRDGNLDLDARGMLVNAGTGFRVQGWEAERGEISTAGSPGTIQIPIGEEMQAQPTSNVVFGGNLDSRHGNGVHRRGSIDVVDSLGETHTAHLDFFREMGATLTTSNLDVGGGAIDITQQYYDERMDGVSFNFVQDDDAEELEVEYAGEQFEITADFDGDDAPTRKQVEEAVNNALKEETDFTGTLKINLSDVNFDDLTGADLAGLDSDDLTLGQDEFGEQPLSIYQDQLVDEEIGDVEYSYDNELQGLDITFDHVTGGDDLRASYETEAHEITIRGEFDDPEPEEIQQLINEELEDYFDGRLIVDFEDNLNFADDEEKTMGLSVSSTWDWQLSEMDGVIDNSLTGDGSLVFDSSGQLIQGRTGNINFDPEINGEPVQDVEIDFADSSNPVSQQATAFTVDGIEADGYTTGDLDSFSINDLGQIVGNYTNGQTQMLGQVALAAFNNPEGLDKRGDTMFARSENSGLARVGEAGRGGRGTITSRALEMSNVDLAEEFTEMITTQRGFQANSSLITTSDEMLQELVNLKR